MRLVPPGDEALPFDNPFWRTLQVMGVSVIRHDEMRRYNQARRLIAGGLILGSSLCIQFDSAGWIPCRAPQSSTVVFADFFSGFWATDVNDLPAFCSFGIEELPDALETRMNDRISEMTSNLTSAPDPIHAPD